MSARRRTTDKPYQLDVASRAAGLVRQFLELCTDRGKAALVTGDADAEEDAQILASTALTLCLKDAFGVQSPAEQRQIERVARALLREVLGG